MTSYSEFSANEILYMGDDALSLHITNIIDESARDPFDIVAELEDEYEAPLALINY